MGIAEKNLNSSSNRVRGHFSITRALKMKNFQSFERDSVSVTHAAHNHSSVGQMLSNATPAANITHHHNSSVQERVSLMNNTQHQENVNPNQSKKVVKMKIP